MSVVSVGMWFGGTYIVNRFYSEWYICVSVGIQ